MNNYALFSKNQHQERRNLLNFDNFTKVEKEEFERPTTTLTPVILFKKAIQLRVAF